MFLKVDIYEAKSLCELLFHRNANLCSLFIYCTLKYHFRLEVIKL